jgi:alkylhydroperoxidase family enzyme
MGRAFAVNGSPFCVGAHSATAAGAYQDEEIVAAVLGDVASAPIDEGLRATLRMLGKLTREGTVTAADIRTVLAVGVSETQIEDALALNFAFNTIDRLANAFSFEILRSRGLRGRGEVPPQAGLPVAHPWSSAPLGVPRRLSTAGRP